MKLIIKQLDYIYKNLSNIKALQPPKEGWLRSIRQALGMSTTQLARRLGITRQSAAEIEQREANGTITLNTLRETANAMDMQLVYILLPKDGTLEQLIDRRARELATEIVRRTSQTMKLEGQENSQARIQEAITERTDAIKRESLKRLWN